MDPSQIHPVFAKQIDAASRGDLDAMLAVYHPEITSLRFQGPVVGRGGAQDLHPEPVLSLDPQFHEAEGVQAVHVAQAVVGVHLGDRYLDEDVVAQDLLDGRRHVHGVPLLAVACVRRKSVPGSAGPAGHS